MADLGTVSILVDVRGQPIVRELATDLNNVAVAETKVSAATQKVMADLQRTRDIMANLKKTTDDASASFQRFSARELQQAGQRMQGFETALANTRRGMGQMGMATQQVGYQVGDFLVQVQSGTNWMVAFGQQATQLVGILPAFSGTLGMSVGSLIALSSGLGIAIPLLTAIGAVFMRTSESADAASKSLDAQKESYDSLSESIRQLRLEQQMAISGMGSSQQAVANDLNQLQAERNVLLAEQEELGRKYNETAYSNVSLAEQELAIRIQANAKAIEDRERLLGIYEQEAQKLRDIEGSLEFSANYITLVAERALDAAEATDKIDFSKAISGAARLAEELGISVSHASRIMALTGGRRATVLDPRDPNYDPIAASMVGIKESYGKVSPFDPSRQPKAPRGGSGGGGAGDSRLTSLLDSLQSEREVIEEWYAESQTILQSASDSELALIGGRNEAKLRLEQEYQEKLKGIRDLGNQTALGQAQTFFGDMASALQGGNDKMLKASRAFAAVEATINAYRAYAQTIADPSLPWWAKIPKALAVLSAGMSVVSAIKGGGSSGGAGGRGSATVSSPTASSPAPQTVFIDSLDPDGLYSGQALINLFDAFYDENDKRGKVFVVAR